MRVRNQIWTMVAVIATGMLLSAPGWAQRGRGGWVPQPAWDAVKQRAAVDLGTSKVKLYKTNFSKGLSRGLQGHLGAMEKAYVVQARAIKASTGRTGTTKRNGPYLAVKSNQGNWEVFPLTLAAQKDAMRPQAGQRITRADGLRPENNTYAFADGLLGGTKAVQAVKAKNTRWTTTIEGQIVASKGRGARQTLFVLGAPNLQDNAPAAYSQIKLVPVMVPRGERDMPPGGLPGGTLRTKFIDVPQPQINPFGAPVANR